MPWTNSDSRPFRSDDFTVQTSSTTQSHTHSISTDDLVSSFSVTVEDGTFKLTYDSGNSLIPTESDFDSGERITDMPMVNIQAWFIEQAEDRFGRTELADAYDGTAGLAEAVLEDAASEMDELLDGGVPPISAFNEAANDWPSEARVLLASYEQENRDRSAYTNYQQELAQIAVDDMMTGDEWQTTLTGPFGANPYNNDSLTDEEATTVLYMAEHGEEATESLLGEIENHEIFREALEDLGDAELAAQYHLFDQSAPNEVLREAAPANEWPDNMTPGNITTKTCEFCGDEYYRIHTDDGVVWCSRHGERHPTTVNIATNDDYMLMDGPTSGAGVLCGTCYPQWEDSTVGATLITEDAAYSFRHYTNIVRDDADETNDFDPFTLANPDVHEMFGEARSPPAARRSDHLVIRPNDAIGNVQPQFDALRELAGSPDEIDSGPVAIVEFGLNDVNAVVYNGRAEPAIEVKEYMEEAV